MGNLFKIAEKEYKIRKIRPEDNQTIAKIVRCSLKERNLDIPGTAYFDPELDSLSDYYVSSDTRGYYVLADEHDNVVGGIGFAEFSHIENCAELQKLYLADCVKGYGLSYVLIEYIENKMAEAGYKISYLETHENLEAAIYIYEKSGYSRIETPENIGHSAMTHFYIKNLGA